jgi:hypothetical protein
MVSVLASSAVDRGLSPDQGKPKTIKLVFVVSPQSTQHFKRESKDWLALNQDNVF